MNLYPPYRSLCATSDTSSFCCSFFNRPHLPVALHQPKLSRQALSGLSSRSFCQFSLIDSAPISLIRQCSRKRTMAVRALPSKICVVDLFFCVALSLALCLCRSVGASSLLLLPQSVSFPSGTSSTSSSRTQSARRSTARRRPVRLHSSPVSVRDPRGRAGSVGDPLQAR